MIAFFLNLHIYREVLSMTDRNKHKLLKDVIKIEYEVEYLLAESYGNKLTMFESNGYSRLVFENKDQKIMDIINHIVLDDWSLDFSIKRLRDFLYKLKTYQVSEDGIRMVSSFLLLLENKRDNRRETKRGTV